VLAQATQPAAVTARTTAEALASAIAALAKSNELTGTPMNQKLNRPTPYRSSDRLFVS